MLDTIGAFGSGIGTNLLSDSLSKKLEAFKDKKAIASFTQSLRDWEIEFEKQNDGTIITNGAFYSHVKYHTHLPSLFHVSISAHAVASGFCAWMSSCSLKLYL